MENHTHRGVETEKRLYNNYDNIHREILLYKLEYDFRFDYKDVLLITIEEDDHMMILKTTIIYTDILNLVVYKNVTSEPLSMKLLEVLGYCFG